MKLSLKQLNTQLNKTIKKVTYDLENLKFNTGIAAMMAFINDVSSAGKINHVEFRTLLVLLSPVAPHITEELWEACGFEGSIRDQSWPTYDENALIEDEIEVVLQINGKVRDKMVVDRNISKEDMEKMVHESDRIKTFIDGKQIVKVIVVPGRLVNVVVK